MNEAPSIWPGIVIGILTLAVLVGQLLVFRRQASIMQSQGETASSQVRLMEAQAGLLRSQHELAKVQVEWRRNEAIGTFYRAAFDLVSEFGKVNVVLPGMPILADFATHPRQMLRDASRLFAPLGNQVVLAANQAAMRLDEYFSAVIVYNNNPRGRDGADRLVSVQALREQVGRDLDQANRVISDDLRWRYPNGVEYDFRTLCSFPGGLSLGPDVEPSE